MTSYLRTKYKMKNCTKEKLHDLDFKYDLIFKDTDPIGLCNCEIKLSY